MATYTRTIFNKSLTFVKGEGVGRGGGGGIQTKTYKMRKDHKGEMTMKVDLKDLAILVNTRAR